MKSAKIFKGARFFEGKKPDSLDQAFVIAEKEIPIATVFKNDDAPTMWEGIDAKSAGIDGNLEAFMLLENGSEQRVFSVGFCGSGADVIMNGSFIEGSPTLLKWHGEPPK